MALPPIQIQLSKFEQIEILRQEIELREGELKQTEKSIREVLFELERQRYLQTIHPIFGQLPQPQQAATLPQLQANREALADAITTMQTALTALESETHGQTAPPSRNPSVLRQQQAGGAGAAGAAGAPRRAKFDSFDDFRANRTGN
ncbi:MAG TPA: hypothetical protein VEJ63_05965 [Planctomycetota bacterium]|nr:hypothetical protein [Planctomycetota bacterium]